jgi:integrase
MTIVPVESSAIIPPAPERGPLRFDLAQLPPPRNPYLVYTQQHPSAGSRSKFRRILNILAEMISPTAGEDGIPIEDSGASIAWWVLRYDDMEVLRNQLMERGCAARTINVYLSALRGVLRVSHRLGLMTADQMMSACSVKTMEVHRLAAGRNISHKEIIALLSASLAGKEPIGTRDAAIVAVTAATGARREEVAGMLIENFDGAQYPYHRQRRQGT